MLGQRRRRWTNIDTTIFEFPVIAVVNQKMEVKMFRESIQKVGISALTRTSLN